jgi:hypothetical protein
LTMDLTMDVESLLRSLIHRNLVLIISSIDSKQRKRVVGGGGGLDGFPLIQKMEKGKTGLGVTAFQIGKRNRRRRMRRGGRIP